MLPSECRIANENYGFGKENAVRPALALAGFAALRMVIAAAHPTTVGLAVWLVPATATQAAVVRPTLAPVDSAALSTDTVALEANTAVAAAAVQPAAAAVQPAAAAVQPAAAAAVVAAALVVLVAGLMDPLKEFTLMKTSTGTTLAPP